MNHIRIESGRSHRSESNDMVVIDINPTPDIMTGYEPWRHFLTPDDARKLGVQLMEAAARAELNQPDDWTDHAS